MEKTKGMEVKKEGKVMMSIGELFSKTFSSFSKQAEPQLLSTLAFLGINIGFMVIIFVLMFVFIGSAIFGLSEVAKDSGNLFSSGASIGAIVAFFILAIIVYLAMIVVSEWNLATLTGIASEYEKGRVLKVKEAFKLGWKYVWKFLGMAILTGIIMVVGFLLFFIPGIILAVMFSVASSALINENLGVVESLKRSWNLVKGHFWAVLGRMLLLLLIIFVITMIAMFIPFLNMIVGFVLMPIIVIYNFLIYKDLVRVAK
jgi:hypothetical protein